MVCALLLNVSCQKRTQLTPWGSLVGDTAQSRQHFTLDDLLMHGEMILLVISGPDTYYRHHGQPVGLQYLLCQQFASHLGLSLRAEICKDTTELFSRLRQGEGDIGIGWGSDSPMHASSSKLKHSRVGGTEWFTYKDNDDLRDAIEQWYSADCLAQARQAQSRSQMPPPRSYTFSAPMLNAGSGLISQYDNLFRRHSAIPRLDWRLLAAQCYQESGFDARAQSWAGAKGLMQLMPSTAKRLGIGEGKVYDPATNIEGGARTMAMLLRLFSDIGDHEQRIDFALAAYNGGYGHIRDAQKLARKYGHNPYTWNSVAPYVLKLSDPHYYNDPVVSYGYMRGEETEAYVRQVRRRYDIYRGVRTSSSASRSRSNSGSRPPDNDNSQPHRATNSHRFEL